MHVVFHFYCFLFLLVPTKASATGREAKRRTPIPSPEIMNIRPPGAPALDANQDSLRSGTHGSVCSFFDERDEANNTSQDLSETLHLSDTLKSSGPKI